MASLPAMAASSAASSAGGDVLRRNFQDLRSKMPEVRANAAKSIRQYLELEAQERSGEGFLQVLETLQKRIATEYGTSLDSSEKLGFILLIDELVVLAAENIKMQLWLMSQLSSIIKDQIAKGSPSEIDILGAATRALGHFARSGSPRLTYVVLDKEVNAALDRMKEDKGEKSEMSRHAAMMVITELSANAPALFLNQTITTFFKNVWSILCDPKIQVRVRAALALRNMLMLEGNRQPDIRDDMSQADYKRQEHIMELYRQARGAFPPAGLDWTNKKKNKATTMFSGSSDKARPPSVDDKDKDPFQLAHLASSEALLLSADSTATYDYNNIPVIHAALLTFYELLDPMANVKLSDKFLEILNYCVWRDEIRFHKDPLIVHHVIALLPRLASCCPGDMLRRYLEKIVRYLLDITESTKEARAQDRVMAFRALGQLAAATTTSFTAHVLSVVRAVRTAIDNKDKGHKAAYCEEALECLEMTIRSQPILSDQVKDELVQMHGLLFNGLSEALVQTLVTLGKALPSLVTTLRKRLLAEITLVLGAAGNSLTASRLGNIVGDESMIGNGGAEVGRGGPPATQKRRGWFFSSSSNGSSSATTPRERLLIKALEQRLGLVTQSADPYLVATLQGVIDGSPPHPSATAVAEATSSLNLKSAFALRRGQKDESGIPGVSAQEMDTYRQRLALRTLGSFDFTGVTVLPLVMAAVVQFLESTNVGVRLEAVIACCRLLSSAAEVTGAFSSRRKMDPSVRSLAVPAASKKASVAAEDTSDGIVADYRTAADYVVERLVVMALTDSDPDIRCRVVEELDSPKFRTMLLENPENLRSMFVLVNDQHFGVRAAAVVAIGHLAEKAPSYIVPAMRTVLVRLLTELDFGGDVRHREESAALLGLLVQSLDPPLARPHVESMLRGLLPKLQDPNPGAAAAMMAALGEVAIVARDSLLPHVGKLLSVVMDTLDERSTHGFMEREVALSTLSKVCRSTIMSIWPYFYQRRLLDVILQVMVSSSSPWPVRRQAMIALGTLGALDPWLHKKNQRENQTLQALGEEFATDWFMASSLESPEFASQRYSLASSVFDLAFGGTNYNSDEEDEFESEFAEDAPSSGADGIDKPNGLGLATSAGTAEIDRNHWKLASRKVANDPLEDALDDFGADLDIVFKAPSSTTFETGKRLSAPNARGSGGIVGKAPSTIRGGPVEALVAEESEGKELSSTPRNLKHTRSRRSSVNFAAAGIAPTSTTQAGQNAVANRAIGAAGHNRRFSLIAAQQHAAQTSVEMIQQKDDSDAIGLDEPQTKEEKNKLSNADRLQRLRALASGARVTSGGDDLGVFGLDPSTILPSMVPTNYDATVSVTALVRVLNDPTTSSKRKEESMSTILKILSNLAEWKKEYVKPFLPHVIPAILRIAKVQLALLNGPVDQRTWPLIKIGELVAIAQRDYRAYLPQTFELTRPYYGDQLVLTDILILAHTIATNLEAKSLQLYVPNLLPELLGILRVERENADINWSNTPAVLGTISALGSALGEYLYLVLPMLMRLVDQTLASTGLVRLDVRVRAVETLNNLVKKCDVADYASRLLHPLCRALAECHLEIGGTTASPRPRASGSGHMSRNFTARTLFVALMDVLTNLVYRLEEEFAVYIPMVEEALQHTLSEAASQGSKSPLQLVGNDYEVIEEYRSLVQRVLRGHALPKPFWYNPQAEDDAAAMESEGEQDGKEPTEPKRKDELMGTSSRDLYNQKRKTAFALGLHETIGDPSQRTTDEDWTEWMRRFSTKLLECSPSYALFACSSLAEVHEPLAQDLFNAAFAAYWGELSRSEGVAGADDNKRQDTRDGMLGLLNKALMAHPPKDILQALLNLAEFMEHDDKPLPLDMNTLGALAFETQAYAKSLHYKEIAFRVSPDKASEKMAEDLIEINKNLDQINAAHGIVEYLKRNNPHQEQQPSWYAQLGIWEKALEAYRLKSDKIRTTNPNPVLDGLTDEEMGVNQGRMDCLKALGEWDKLAELADEKRLEIRDMKRQARKNRREADIFEDDYIDTFGKNAPPTASVALDEAKSPSAALATTYVFDRLQGYGDRFRPVSVLLKNSNRAAATGDRIFFQGGGGDGRQGMGQVGGAAGGVDAAGQSQASATSSGIPRRVSYLDTQALARASPIPRRSPSGVGLADMAQQRTARSSMDASDQSDRVRYGKDPDQFEKDKTLVNYIQEVNKLGAYANWMLRRWHSMRTYVQVTSENSYDGNFLRAVLDIEMDHLNSAEARVEAAYRKLGQEVTSNFGETYSRAYARIVRVQELAELQELISYKRLVKRTRDGRQEEAKKEFGCLKKLWRQRLQGVQQNVDVLLPILAVRSMVVEPKEDIDTWLNFAKVARKQGRKLLSLKALMNLGIGSERRRGGRNEDDDGEEVGVHPYNEEDDDNVSHFSRRSSMGGSAMAALTALHEDDANLNPYPSPLFPSRNPPSQSEVHPRVVYAYINHLWTVGEQEEKLGKQRDAVSRMKKLARGLTDSLSHRLGPGPMETVGDLPVIPSEHPVGPASHMPEAQVLGGAPRRRSQQPRGKSKLSLVTTAGGDWGTGGIGGPMAEDLVASLLRFPEEQLLRLAVRSNCQLGDWVKSLYVPLAESQPQRSASMGRDVDSLASYTSKGVLQTAQRARGMTPTFSFMDNASLRSSNINNNNSQSESLTAEDARRYNDTLHEALKYYESAIRLDNASYRAWRLWALTNYEAVRLNSRLKVDSPGRIVCAVGGLFRSIELGSEEMKMSVLQDTLRLLELWFTHGHLPVVIQALTRKMYDIPKTTWLEVIPQLIARVNEPTGLVSQLLTSIGRVHPQQLLFPLTVASDQNRERSTAAQQIMKTLENVFPVLVEQARLVSKELIRVAVLWPEMWHEGLEEASQLYFSSTNRNIEQMIETLEQLHKRMDDPGPETLSEVGFAHAFGRDLKEAYEWLQAYRESPDQSDLSFLNQAWDLYYKVFKVISKQLDVKNLELRRVSPQLLHASGLQLAVPGRYVDAMGEPIRIEQFSPTLRVIKSKQRPRVITMKGSDGADHMFLLKGHEDLRLDERVMQLLGLVNNLLAADGETHRADVEIQKYAVVPLSARAGVMQWVPHCDTLHELIREYRETRKIPANVEMRIITEFAPQYETLTPMQKVEVFEHAINETSGQDLAKVLWLKSANSETWLDRRTNFTRSLAAMSIVGYVLGLGDRHPSNLMCERASGRILHIDFGDCFEVAMNRAKFPEGVPFRLTRMLVNAMEVSGVEGNYRITCQNVMRVLRANRESVMTMLEAFVHDPLITWRLFQPKGRPSAAGETQGGGGADSTKPQASETEVSNDMPTPKTVGSRAVHTMRFAGLGGGGDLPSDSNIGSVMEYGYSSLVSHVSANPPPPKKLEDEADRTAAEKNNQRALEVRNRVMAKLYGRDFDPDVTLDVNEQVDRLIRQAQAHENLAVMYSGWSPVW